jgi:UDP-glucose 4-epimerase
MYSLVIGGHGFIGSHLVVALLQNGQLVRSFDRPGVLPLLVNTGTNANLDVVEGDFLSGSDLSKALVDCDICYHLVSTTTPRSSNEDPVFDIESNILGTVRLLNEAVKAGVKKIIFVSSGGTVYGVPTLVPTPESHATNPTCSYGITKLAIEKYLDLYYKLHGLNYSILRVANPYGMGQQSNKGQGAIAVFLHKALRGEEIEIWGDGSIIRDYVYIDDVISALQAAANYDGAEHVFNIGAGKGLSLNGVLDSIDRLIGHPTARNYVEGRGYDVPSNILSVEKAKQELQWEPAIDFEVGLGYFLNYLKYSKNAGR